MHNLNNFKKTLYKKGVMQAVLTPQLVLLVDGVEKASVPYDLSIIKDRELYVEHLACGMIRDRIGSVFHEGQVYNKEEEYTFYIRNVQSKVNDIIEDIDDDISEFDITEPAKIIRIRQEVVKLLDEPKDNKTLFCTTTSYFNGK